MNRRTFCAAAGGIGGACLAGLAGCLGRPSGDEDGAVSDPDDWPSFGANAGHTGYKPAGRGPATGTVSWSAIGDAPTVLCSPTVKDGTVYTGSAADALHAFDAEAGDPVWKFGTDDYVETAPAVKDGTVYTADSSGVVYAVTTDGDEVWRHETDQNLHSRALAVHDGSVYVGTAGNMPAVASGDTDKSKAGKVVALDAGDGSERWTFDGPEDWFSGPAAGGGRVYVGNHTGSVFALDPSSGEKLWSWTPSGEGADHAAILAPPTYADGTVYAAVHAAGWVVALDAKSGEETWRTNLKAENVKSSPAVTDDRVYVGSHRVRGVVPEAGGEEDETPTTTPSGTPTPEPGTYGRLYALSRSDGSTEWVHETDHDFRSSPAVVGDRVYVGGGDGAIAVTRDDGSEVWHVSFEDFVYSSPAVADGRLYVGSADGHLYCVGDR